jgi:hypothetical protein
VIYTHRGRLYISEAAFLLSCFTYIQKSFIQCVKLDMEETETEICNCSIFANKVSKILESLFVDRGHGMECCNTNFFSKFGGSSAPPATNECAF